MSFLIKTYFADTRRACLLLERHVALQVRCARSRRDFASDHGILARLLGVSFESCDVCFIVVVAGCNKAIVRH